MEDSEYGKYGVAFAVSIVLLSMVLMRKKKKEKIVGVTVKVGGEEGFAVRNARHNGLVPAPYAGVTTVASLFQLICEHYSGQVLFLTRKLINKDIITAIDGTKLEKLYLADRRTWKTYDHVYYRVRIFAAGLVELGHDIDTRVAIFSEPRDKCQFVLQGCFRQAITVVILDASLSEEHLVHCLNESQVSTLVCDSKQLNKLTAISSSLRTMRKVIYFENDFGYRATTNMCVSSESKKDWKLISLHEVERLGREVHVSPRMPYSEDVAVIMYTSSCSADFPKGVMITHGNLVAATTAVKNVIPRLKKDDVYMAYLPLTHISELAIELAMMSSRCQIAYGSPWTLTDTSSKIMEGTRGDVSVLKPTIMAAVPAMIDHVREAVLGKVEEEGSKKHFDIAYKRRLAAIQGSWFGAWGLEKWFWDASVFESARAILGGQIRFMLSAEAPLSVDSRRFINICIGAPIGQVYGSTETCGAVAFNVQWGDTNVSRVGPPLSCCYIKLVSWEEGGYTISEKPMPRGEVVVGGLGVTMGYFNNDMETMKVYKVDEGGMHWFYTGDIGQFLPDGSLEIIDISDYRIDYWDFGQSNKKVHKFRITVCFPGIFFCRENNSAAAMSTISIYRSEFLTFSCNGSRARREFQRIPFSPTMKMDSKSFEAKKEQLSVQLQTPSIPQLENSKPPSGLRFDRMQPSDHDPNDKRLEFGNFVAREPLLDEELWTAAWLRAESHWEDRPPERYVDNFKRKFADEEFNALKRRCKGIQGQTCTCVVTVKEDRNAKRTVLKSVVGTLDFSIRYLLQGESFPGECAKASFCSIIRTHNKYAYVSNLCVAKSARRQGIASNMLYFAIELARESGVELVYVHVHRHNGPALELYQTIGFEVVEMASPQLVEQQMYLLCFRT
ncbi:hypothetical protein CCACVL1_20719 [Corchorus capsularis]|uniref:N-acetyltransferase domain-containing protein n=1 Tax=Corchorus capsularis TaxID=210143 RepID=A0A1R3HA41_COCAP|nr:hypothetical protein CCACVL1_20719 [Corchorus capsularis]